MFVGVCVLELRIPGSFSLKDKRQVVRSAVQRMRQKFNVSVAEVGELDLWNVASLGIVCATRGAPKHSGLKRRADAEIGTSTSRGAVVKAGCSGMAAYERTERTRKEILTLVATGASNKEIAAKLDISASTVKVHLYIFAKMEVWSGPRPLWSRSRWVW